MLKKFKDLVSEVAEPISQGEKNFKALHVKADNRDLVPGVTDQDFLFKGRDRRIDKPTASYEKDDNKDESEIAYDRTLKREEAEQVSEKLVGGQKNIDKNKNGKLDGEDFALLRKTKVVAKPQYDKMRPAFKEEIEQIEERVDPKDYTVTSEPSKLKAGGHRPMVVHKDKGTTMYLGQTSYGSAEHAKGHAKAYLAGYAMGGDVHAMRKGDEYRKANAKHVVEEIEQIDELSPATLSSYKTKAAGSEKALTDKSSTLSVPPKERNIAALKAHQRRMGMKAATSKMAEETDAVDEGLISGIGSVISGTAKLAGRGIKAAAPHVARGAVAAGKAAVSGAKAAAHRVTVAGRADAAEKKAGKVEKKISDYARLKSAKERLSSAQQKLRTNEEVELDEKTLTSAEMKKREEVVKAIKRENPKMDKSMAYAIATKTAKRVAEASELGPESKIKDNKHYNSSDYVSKNVKFANARAAEVSKVVKHDCAKHVAHEEWGVGTCIPGEHTLVESANGEGFVTHYDVFFDHGVESNVPVEDLQILVSESHEHSRKGMKEDIDYDYEGEMARAELNAICDKARTLADMMEDDMQLEAWLQSKITKAKYMIDSVYDYLMYSNRNQAGTGPTPSTVSSPSEYNQSAAMTDTYGTFLNRMGEEIERVEEAMDKSLAALAPPKDKVTYADKIVGAKLQAAKDKAKGKKTESDDSEEKEDMKEDLDFSIISDEEKTKLEEIMKAE